MPRSYWLFIIIILRVRLIGRGADINGGYRYTLSLWTDTYSQIKIINIKADINIKDETPLSQSTENNKIEVRKEQILMRRMNMATLRYYMPLVITVLNYVYC